MGQFESGAIMEHRGEPGQAKSFGSALWGQRDRDLQRLVIDYNGLIRKLFNDYSLWIAANR
jgi:hypothetical protein